MPRKSKTSKEIDIYANIARRIKLRRLMLGMTQTDLAKACGVTFQEIQKYEAGTNGCSVQRLYDISLALKVPLMFFFSELNNECEQINKTESLELINLYLKLPKQHQKDLVYDVLKNLNKISPQ